MLETPRSCNHCQGPMPQRADEPGHKYATRRYCGKTCMYGARRGRTPHNKGANRAVDAGPSSRTCRNCAKTLVARAEESVDQFALRSYCDRTCARAKVRFELKTLPERF